MTYYMIEYLFACAAVSSLPIIPPYCSSTFFTSIFAFFTDCSVGLQ